MPPMAQGCKSLAQRFGSVRGRSSGLLWLSLVGCLHIAPARGQESAKPNEEAVTPSQPAETTPTPTDAEVKSAGAPAKGEEGADTESGDSRIKPGLLHLGPIEASLLLEGRYERRRVSSSGGQRFDSTQRNRDWFFSEGINLKLNGDIVDPNLVSWSGEFTLGYSQERSRESIDGVSETDTDSGSLLDYNVSLDLLPSQPISANVYARSLRDRIPRRFLPSLLEERREAGARVFGDFGRWRTELGVDWSDVERTGNDRAEDDESYETDRFFWDNRWAISDQHTLRLEYQHEREQSEYQGSRGTLDTRRDQLKLEHEYAFGPAGRHRLDTFLRWNDEQGDLARDELEFIPRLTLQHSDRFKSIWRYSLYRTDQDELEILRQRADLETVYTPLDGLRLHTDVFGQWESYEDDVDIDTYGALGDASWTIPTDRGELAFDGSLSYDQERTSGSGKGRQIRGESHVLDSARPTYLAEPDIDRFSIVATNAARTRVFAPGVDYQVVQVGRRTTVYRILSGRIGDGEPVYFDYTSRVPADALIDTWRADLSIEHRFTSGWTPYYAFEVRRQDANGSRGTPVFEDNTERHRVGLRYERPTWSVVGEFEHYDDSVEPYQGYSLDSRAALWRTEAQSVDASARVAYYDFHADDAERRVWWIDMDLAHRARITTHLETTLKTAYRWEDHSRDGETNGVDLEGGLHFQRGRLGVDVIAEYNLLNIREDEDEGFGLWLYVRRDLGDLLASASAPGGGGVAR